MRTVKGDEGEAVQRKERKGSVKDKMKSFGTWRELVEWKGGERT